MISTWRLNCHDCYWMIKRLPRECLLVRCSVRGDRSKMPCNESARTVSAKAWGKRVGFLKGGVPGFHRYGYPLYRWMVEFMENPKIAWMMTGGTPSDLGNLHMVNNHVWSPFFGCFVFVGKQKHIFVGQLPFLDKACRKSMGKFHLTGQSPGGEEDCHGKGFWHPISQNFGRWDLFGGLLDVPWCTFPCLLPG